MAILRYAGYFLLFLSLSLYSDLFVPTVDDPYGNILALKAPLYFPCEGRGGLLIW